MTRLRSADGRAPHVRHRIVERMLARKCTFRLRTALNFVAHLRKLLKLQTCSPPSERTTPHSALKSHGFFRRLLSKVTILVWPIGIARSAMSTLAPSGESRVRDGAPGVGPVRRRQTLVLRLYREILIGGANPLERYFLFAAASFLSCSITGPSSFSAASSSALSCSAGQRGSVRCTAWNIGRVSGSGAQP